MGACDAARILRAAGSLNHKHHEPRAVTCTRLTGEIFTRAAEVVGGLADSHHYPKPARPTDARRVSGDPSRILAGLARSVADARVKNRNRMLHWAACRVREHADAGKLDEGHAREELRAAAVHAGLDEFEIEQTIRSGLRKLEAA